MLVREFFLTVCELEYVIWVVQSIAVHVSVVKSCFSVDLVYEALLSGLGGI